MTVTEALSFIHGIARFNKQLGLEKIRALLERMGNPQNKLQFVHVAGTNGKGSTCTMLSNILTTQGYRTGLYISPYVIRFNERIQINGEMISDSDLAAITTMVKQHWDELAKLGEPPSEFEVVLAIALQYYVQNNVDIVVLETGMGGRLDATNIIPPPLVSAIVSISLEHTFYLGDTLTKIAWEKADIIKPGSIAVSYPKQELEVVAVLMERCAQVGVELVIPHKANVLHMDITGSRIIYDNTEYHITMAGEHQIYNTLVVLEVCKALQTRGFALATKAIQYGIAQTQFVSRLEALHQNPLVLLDGAHNIAGIEALANALTLLQGRNVHAVIGILRHKDVHEMCEIFGPLCSTIVTTAEPNNPMFLEPQALAQELTPYCNNVTTAHTPAAAFAHALRQCQGDDVVLICGSLYLTSAIRPIVLDYFKEL